MGSYYARRYSLVCRGDPVRSRRWRSRHATRVATDEILPAVSGWSEQRTFNTRFAGTTILSRPVRCMPHVHTRSASRTWRSRSRVVDASMAATLSASSLCRMCTEHGRRTWFGGVVRGSGTRRRDPIVSNDLPHFQRPARSLRWSVLAHRAEDRRILAQAYHIGTRDPLGHAPTPPAFPTKLPVPEANADARQAPVGQQTVRPPASLGAGTRAQPCGSAPRERRSACPQVSNKQERAPPTPRPGRLEGNGGRDGRNKRRSRRTRTPLPPTR